MSISAQDVKALREKTGAGMMDCKRALQEVEGDFEKAIESLKKSGLAKAVKKGGRIAADGLIFAKVNGSDAVLVELNCETDFVSRCAEFKQLSKDLAMQIAALNPGYIKKEDVPQDVVKEQKEHLEDFYRQRCLLEQLFIKDQTRTIKDYLTELIAKVGENIVVRRFVRFQLGEVIECQERPKEA